MSGSSGGSKSLILASYMIVLKDFIDKIDRIIDIQLLRGYYKPTLLIMYEPLNTFSGWYDDFTDFLNERTFSHFYTIFVSVTVLRKKLFLGSFTSYFESKQNQQNQLSCL